LGKSATQRRKSKKPNHFQIQEEEEKPLFFWKFFKFLNFFRKGKKKEKNGVTLQ